MTQFTYADRIPAEILALGEELVQIRHDVHAHPELGFETTRTCGVITKHLKAWGIPFDDAFAKGAVVAWVDGNRPGKTVALRADMDALSMPDESATGWQSTCENRAHTCGHDGHVAWLLGAMRTLHDHPDFPGRVVGIFQPAEEIGRGARSLVEAKVLERFDVKEIYGAHGTTAFEKGIVGVHAGPSQASCDFFYVTLTGRGSHAARPHQALDPVATAGLLSQAFQMIVSRKIDPLEPCVVSICAVQAGSLTAPNVIPNELKLSGTIRTFNNEVRSQVEREMRRMAEGIAESQGLKCEVRVDHLTPALINSEVPALAGKAMVEKLFGKDAWRDTPMGMAGEDFAEYVNRIPGTMIQVGMADEAHNVGLHNPKMDFNDAVIPEAVWLLSSLAKARLEALSD